MWKRMMPEQVTLTGDILDKVWAMASPLTGLTAVAEVIKDLDTQIAVSKQGWHVGFPCESAPPVSFVFRDLGGM